MLFRSRQDEYNSCEELEQAIIKEYKPIIIKPLFLIDHSGITISTKDFNDRWDSGQVGFVLITRKSLKDCYGVKRISKEIKKKAATQARREGGRGLRWDRGSRPRGGGTPTGGNVEKHGEGPDLPHSPCEQQQLHREHSAFGNDLARKRLQGAGSSSA